MCAYNLYEVKLILNLIYYRYIYIIIIVYKTLGISHSLYMSIV